MSCGSSGPNLARCLSVLWRHGWRKAAWQNCGRFCGSARVWLEEARLLHLDGRADTAVETLRPAVRRFAGDSAVAAAYGAAGQWEDAQRVLAGQPGAFRLRFILAICHLETSAPDNAISSVYAESACWNAGYGESIKAATPCFTNRVLSI